MLLAELLAPLSEISHRLPGDGQNVFFPGKGQCVLQITATATIWDLGTLIVPDLSEAPQRRPEYVCGRFHMNFNVCGQNLFQTQATATFCARDSQIISTVRMIWDESLYV